LLKILVEKTVLEQNQVDDRHADIGVGQIEDGSEEIVPAVDQKTQPRGHTVPLKEREVEHVDHATHHEAGIMTAELGDGRRRGGREDQPVEGAVEDVADSAGQNQTETDDGSGRGLHLHQPVDEPKDEPAQPHAKQAEGDLAPVDGSARLDPHAESRSVVLDEAELKPVGDDDNRFVEPQMGLDPDFERLIRQQKDEEQDRYFFPVHCRMIFVAVQRYE